MPTYEYRCPEGHQFDRFFRKMSDAATELPCPECGKPAVKQLSGGAGLLFKGSGFYLTDYGKNAHRKGGEGPSSKGESSSGGESKGESKSTESKSTESKSTESKPAADKPASKPSGTSGTSGSSGGSKAGD